MKIEHNHLTRDLRPADCPACYIQQLKNQIKELEAVAEQWMQAHDRLKEKYEPEELVES